MTASRTIVISDIHGCNLTFRKLLFGQIRLVKADTLYLLGDYIDRGPDSSGVIGTILQMKEDGYNVMAIKGNHEQLFIGALRTPIFEIVAEWLDNGGYTTLKSYGITEPTDLPYDHLLFLTSLPLYLATETHIFVHAGLDFLLDDPLSDKGEHSMLWKRLGDVDGSKIRGRILVSGHTPLPLSYIELSLASLHIRLDNGCVYGDTLPEMGNLVALELESKRLFVQRNID